MVERLPIIHHKDELKTQTSRITLRYPLSPSSVASSVRQVGHGRQDNFYPYEKRPRNVREILPLKEPKYLPYQSTQTGVCKSLFWSNFSIKRLPTIRKLFRWFTLKTFKYPFQTRRHYITTYDDENRASKVNFKCTAKIGNGYWQSVEEETIVKRQVLPLESRSSASSGM